MENKDLKKTIAKLYNFKSYIDGKIMELNEGLATPEGVGEGLALMVNKVLEELKSQNAGTALSRTTRPFNGICLDIFNDVQADVFLSTQAVRLWTSKTGNKPKNCRYERQSHHRTIN